MEKENGGCEGQAGLVDRLEVGPQGLPNTGKLTMDIEPVPYVFFHTGRWWTMGSLGSHGEAEGGSSFKSSQVREDLTFGGFLSLSLEECLKTHRQL